MRIVKRSTARAVGGILEHNVGQLGIDLKQLDAVVISHRHGDHTTGLGYLLKVNPGAMIYRRLTSFPVSS
jgi:7,8-dihydropterin-6-yl-methyl-4-(beta-D-ribofuranosyl)aminobenzene 5'-phosphate synthase